MRLDDFDPNEVDVEDQRGGGGGGFRLPLGGTGGKLGCGTIVIALIAALVFGVDPAQMLGGLQQAQQSGAGVSQSQVRGGTTAADICTVDAMSKESCNTLSSLNKTWEPVFKQSNVAFQRPKLVF